MGGRGGGAEGLQGKDAATASDDFCSDDLGCGDLRTSLLSDPAAQDAPLERGTESGALVPASFLESLKMADIWHLAVMSFCSTYVITGMTNELILFLTEDAGMSLMVSSSMSSIIFVTSFCGKLCIGVWLDSPWRSAATINSYVCFLVGTLIPLDLVDPFTIELTHSTDRLTLFTLIYGFAFGCCFGIVSATPGKLFSKMAGFEQLQAFFTSVQVLGGFFGTVLSGKLRTLTGSYAAAFCAFAAAAVFSLLHCVALEMSLARRRERFHLETAAKPGLQQGAAWAGA